MDKRKELKMAYKQSPRPMGVYQIKNHANGKIFIGSSMNIPGIFNSHRFQLNQKVHRNKNLQNDWDLYGSDSFSFDILEILEYQKYNMEEWRDAVTILETKWLTILEPYEEKGYNKKATAKLQHSNPT